MIEMNLFALNIGYNRTKPEQSTICIKTALAASIFVSFNIV